MDKEIFEVYGFKNTGFSVGNSPDCLNTIMASPLINNYLVKCDDIYRLQPYILDSIDIAKPFNEVQGLDYVILQSKNGTYERIGYFVTDIQMLNTNTARVYMSLDTVGTIGLGYTNKYEILYGWTTRRHYTSTEDTLFANVLPESFLPVYPPVIKTFEMNFSQERTNIIASTLNISDNLGKLKLNIKKLESPDSVILKPIITGGTTPTIVTLPKNSETGGFTQQVQSLTLYDGSVLGKEVLNELQAYDMLNVITASYQVPSELLSASQKSGAMFTSISGTGKGYTSTLPFKFTTAKNNKVFANGSVYTLLSVLSGESENFEAWEIYVNEEPAPKFNLMADITPSGKPYCRPEYYRRIKGDGMFSYFKTVSGTVWNNVPIITNGQNGWAYNNIIENVNKNMYNVQLGALNNKLSTDLSNTEFSNASNRLSYRKERNALNNQLMAWDKYGNQASQDLYNLNLSRNSGFKNTVNATIGAFTSGGGGSALFNTSGAYSHLSTRSTASHDRYLDILNNSFNKGYYEELVNLSNLANANMDINKASIELQGKANIELLDYNRQKELAEFTVVNSFAPPTYSFANDSGLQNFLGNGFLVIQECLDDRDVARFDKYLTRFGYSVNEPLNTSFFNNRRYYNYINANNVKIKNNSGKLPQYILDSLSDQLSVGVRVWHTFPNSLTEQEIDNNPDM